MPLIKGKSEKSFKKNVETEMNAGKPQKQSLAIAFAMKRRAAKKMAEGGDATKDSTSKIDDQDMVGAAGGPEMSQASGFQKHRDDEAILNEAARIEDERALNQHGAIEEGPQGAQMAEGGQITDNYADTEDGDGEDMVGRIMKQRQQMFSEGGKVANEDHGPKDSRLAGFDPNEFDDLALRDDLEFSETGANSGDELSSEGEDERRKDMVSRIMASRAKKDRLPNPR